MEKSCDNNIEGVNICKVPIPKQYVGGLEDVPRMVSPAERRRRC